MGYERKSRAFVDLIPIIFTYAFLSVIRWDSLIWSSDVIAYRSLTLSYLFFSPALFSLFLRLKRQSISITIYCRSQEPLNCGRAHRNLPGEATGLGIFVDCLPFSKLWYFWRLDFSKTCVKIIVVYHSTIFFFFFFCIFPYLWYYFKKRVQLHL